MLGKVSFDDVNALERYGKGMGKVIFHTHLQNLNGSLSKVKGDIKRLCKTRSLKGKYS